MSIIKRILVFVLSLIMVTSPLYSAMLDQQKDYYATGYEYAKENYVAEDYFGRGAIGVLFWPMWINGLKNIREIEIPVPEHLTKGFNGAQKDEFERGYRAGWVEKRKTSFKVGSVAGVGVALILAPIILIILGKSLSDGA